MNKYESHFNVLEKNKAGMQRRKHDGNDGLWERIISAHIYFINSVKAPGTSYANHKS